MRIVNQARSKASFARWGNIAPIRRFLSYVQLDIARGCWLWTGALNVHGYGQFHDSSRDQQNIHAFRWSYEYFKGAPPPNLQIDHLCRIRSCVNPDHLEAVTLQINVRRGAAYHANNICNRGHNDWAPDSGRRRCRVCRNANRIKNRRK